MIVVDLNGNEQAIYGSREDLFLELGYLMFVLHRNSKGPKFTKKEIMELARIATMTESEVDAELGELSKKLDELQKAQEDIDKANFVRGLMQDMIDNHRGRR